MNDSTDETQPDNEASDPLAVCDTEELRDTLVTMFLEELRPKVVEFVTMMLGIQLGQVASYAPVVEKKTRSRSKGSRPASDAAESAVADFASRDRIDDETVAAAVGMVAKGMAKDVAPNVLLAAKRRGLVKCVGRGRFAQHSVTDEGQQIADALEELAAAEEAGSSAFDGDVEAAGLAAADAIES